MKLILKISPWTICAVSFLFIMIGCGSPKNTTGEDDKLQAVNQELLNGDVAPALEHIEEIDVSTLSDDSKPLYYLLLTQANYKNYVQATSDSLINIAVVYYSKSSDIEKYTRALIYQGCVNEELGNLDLAVSCYNKAENIASSSDLVNKAFVKMRLGFLYQSQYVGANILSVNKFKEALDIYKEIDDKHYTILCLSEIGLLYRNDTIKADSALFYINDAIRIASELPDEKYYLCNNYSCRAEYYAYIIQDYDKAKKDALKAISFGPEYLEHPKAHLVAAKCYLQDGKRDSCDYYLNRCPPLNTVGDSIGYYRLLSDINLKDGNQEKAFELYKRTVEMSDSTLLASLNHRLLEVEKKYDSQQVELQNECLKSDLKSTLLALSAIVIIALVLFSLFVRYRSKLRIKESEYEFLKEDLNASLLQLESLNATVGRYDEELKTARSRYDRMVDEASANLRESESEQELLKSKIAELVQKQKRSEGLKSIVGKQIGTIQKLIQWSYELKSDNFAVKFNEAMAVSDNDDDITYWSNLQTIVNDLYNDILFKAQETSGNTLREDELNFLALCVCGFSRTLIMICMRYKNIVTVSNKKAKIATKLNEKSLDDFIAKHKG